MVDSLEGNFGTLANTCFLVETFCRLTIRRQALFSCIVICLCEGIPFSHLLKCAAKANMADLLVLQLWRFGVCNTSLHFGCWSQVTKAIESLQTNAASWQRDTDSNSDGAWDSAARQYLELGLPIWQKKRLRF